MTKGSYSIRDDPDKSPRKDTSFKSFICALLVFLALCLIIFLATYKWSSGKTERKPIEENDKKNDAEVLAVGFNNTRKNEQQVIITVPEATPTYRETTKFYKVLTQPVTKNAIEQFDEVTTLRPINDRNETNKIEDEDSKENFGQTTKIFIQWTTDFSEDKTKNPVLDTTEVFDEVTVREKSATNFEQEIIGARTTEFVSENPINRESEIITTLTSERDESSTKIVATTKIGSISKNSNLVTEEVATTVNTFEETTTVEGVIPETTAEEILVTTADSNILTTEGLLTEHTRNDNENLTELTESVIPHTLLETTTSSYDFETSTTSLTSTTSSTSTASTILTASTTSNTSTVSTTQTQFLNETVTTPHDDEPTESPQDKVTDETTERLPTASAFTSRKNPYSTKSAIISKNLEPLCRSSACNSAASRMLSLMNHSTSPCEDFYEFACGGALPGWQESADSTDADMLSTHLSSVNNSSDKYLKDYRNFYDSCVEHENSFKYGERIKVVKDLLSDVGEFRVESQPLDLDITDLFAKLIGRQSMPLLDIGLDVDRQSSNFILQLTLPQESFLRIGVEDWSALSWHKKRCLKQQQDRTHSRFLNLNDTYLSYLNCQRNYSGYLNSIEDTVRELGIFAQLNSTRIRKEIKDIRFTIEFDVLNLIDTFPPPAEVRTKILQKSYDVRRVSDLQAQYPILKWKKLLTTLTGHSVQDNAIVQVYFGKDFTQMFKSLANVDRRVLNNALLAVYANDLFMNTVVSRESSDRERFCLELSQKLLPDVTSYLVKSWHLDHLADAGKKTVSELFAVLKEKFSKSLMGAEWLDDTSRISIMTKFNRINLAFFTEPDRNRLISDYEDVNVTGNYQRNLVNLLVHSRRAAWATEGTQFSAQTIYSYFLRPTDTQPLIFPTNGLIAVPLGLLKRAADGLPGYLIMARVGLHLAREIARNFDPTEIKFAKLSESARASYSYLISTTETLVDYSSPRLFGTQNVTFKLNGALSTNERITENAAFRLILDSFTSFGNEELLPWISGSYSREKVFFIGVAQEYCKKTSVLEFMLQVFESANLPAPLRVENIMGNSDVFSEKFSCPEGSGMNLFAEKVQFPYLTQQEDYDEDTQDMYKN